MDEKTPIKALCEQYGLTQVELANRFGIPLRTIGDWAVGKRKPPSYVVEMMQQLLSPIPACSFTHDFDAAMRLKTELTKEIPGLFEKLSMVELDMLIGFIHDKTINEIQSRS